MPPAPHPPRPVPERIEDRLIVALDLADAGAARAMAERLDGIVSFFKLGLWLIFAEFERRRRLRHGKGLSRRQDVRHQPDRETGSWRRRARSAVTVHGDHDIIRAAVEGRRGSDASCDHRPHQTCRGANGPSGRGADPPPGRRVPASAVTDHRQPGRCARNSPPAGCRKLLVVTPGCGSRAALDDQKLPGRRLRRSQQGGLSSSSLM